MAVFGVVGFVVVVATCTACQKLSEVNDDSVLIDGQFHFCSVTCFATFEALIEWKPRKGRKAQ